MNQRRGERFVLWLAIGATLAILASTIVFPHPEAVIMDRLVLLSIVLIGVVARKWGIRAGLGAAVASFLAIGGLIYPRGFEPGLSVELYVDLVVFLVVALVSGVQTGDLREREKAALENEQAMELVNRLGSRMISSTPRSEMLDSVLTELGRAVDAEFEFVLTVDETGGLTPARAHVASRLKHLTAAAAAAHYAYEHGIAIGHPASAEGDKGSAERFTAPRDVGLSGVDLSLFVPLVSASGSEGVLYFGPRTDGRPYSLRHAQMITLVAGLLALFFERVRLQAAASRLVALEQADELKSALVSSVSHELRSPLAAVAATITGLLAEGIQLDNKYVRTELQSAAEDLQTLDRRIGEILDISRLEASAWAPLKEWHDVADLCSAAVNAFPDAARIRLKCAVSRDVPPARFDFVQVQRALHHIVENALTYSPSDSDVIVGADADGDLRLWVEDRGPGVAGAEQDLIFQKFYRGSAAKTHPHGTGLGLAIAAEIARQHGGGVDVEPVSPHGSRFVIHLPIDEDGA